MTNNSKYPEEGKTMESINTGGYVANEMYDRINYGRGYGSGVGAYANTSTLQHGIESNRQFTENANDNHTDALRAGLGHISDSFENAQRASQFNTVTDGQFRAELRNSDHIAALIKDNSDMRAEAAKCCCDTQKAIADAAKEAAKCCCDAQLAACKSHAEITATVLADGAKTRELIRGDALAAANAKIVQLETINALRS